MKDFVKLLLYSKLKPIQILVIGFLILTLVGTILLILPFSAQNGEYNSFVDALFTSVSAVSTTGLIVVDTGSFYTLTGQIIILVLIQIGGLGYMLFIVLLIAGLGDELSIGTKKLLRESYSRHTEIEIKKFIKLITLMTLFIETAGALGLFLYLVRNTGFEQALYSSIFHSISAFCTAGFSIYKDSFVSFRSSWFINLFISGIAVLGAIGFPVLYDLYLCSKNHFRSCSIKISVHSKIVITITLIIIITGTILILPVIGADSLISIKAAILDSSFQVITASTTTGFNTIDISIISDAALFLLILIMFIGASPGSTGGGIKTSTFALVCKSVYSGLKGTSDVSFYKRKMKEEVIRKSFLILLISAAWVTICIIFLSITEEHDFIKIMFEIVSAFGTVGLSAGITPDLSVAGKLIISLTMFIGRVGPLAFGLFIVTGKKPVQIQFAESNIIVG